MSLSIFCCSVWIFCHILNGSQQAICVFSSCVHIVSHMLPFCDVKVQVGASISSWFNQFFSYCNSTSSMGTQASQNISRETSNPKVDPVDQQLLKLLSDDPDDVIMLFLRSLAPQMRIVPADRQFSLWMEMMQLMIRYAQRPAVS